MIIQSAVDALAHAIEAYLSTIASPFTEMQSLKAIDLIIRHLPQAVETKSLDCLEKLSIASVAASMAFSNASLGAEHALAHSLGGHFDMRHGVIHPILLTAVMRFNLQGAEAKLADIGRVILDRKVGSARDTALAGIEKLDEFFASFNVPQKLREEISEEEKHFLKPICQMAVNDACILTNPRPPPGRNCWLSVEEVW